MTEKEKKLLSAIGLCKRAGKLVIGTPMVCERLRRDSAVKSTDDRIYMVIEACDTSDNTHEKIVSKCNYYGVPHQRIFADSATLAHTVGKTAVTAAVGVTDKELLKCITKQLEE